MHLTVLGTDPYTGCDGRSISDEPSVRLIVSSTCLTGNLAFETIFRTKAHTGTAVHHTLHEVGHQVGCVFAYGLTLGVIEFSEHVTHAVLDPCHEDRRYVYTMRREGIIGCNHLIHSNIRRSDAKRIHRIEIASDTHFPHHLHHSLRTVLLHQIGGNIVGTLCESPFESDGLADPLVLVRTCRSPCILLVDDEGLRYIHHLVTWAHSLLHGKSIEERLDCRSHLSLALTDIVIFEIAVVRSADICLYMSCLWLYGHECSTKMRLVILYRVVRSHRCVDVSVPVP